MRAILRALPNQSDVTPDWRSGAFIRIAID
jgi:hypothetical protein